MDYEYCLFCVLQLVAYAHYKRNEAKVIWPNRIHHVIFPPTCFQLVHTNSKEVVIYIQQGSQLRMREQIERNRKRDGHQYPCLIAHALLIFTVRWGNLRRAISMPHSAFKVLRATQHQTKIKWLSRILSFSTV